MSQYDPTIIDHWSNRCDISRIDAALNRAGLGPATATAEQLAAHDQLHVGTLAATRELADWAGIESGSRVLDLGAGVGGAARYLARERGARVTAVELTPVLHEAAQELTRRAGLEDRVQHRLGDCTAFAGGAYDLVWIQHADMQVADKAGLYRTVAQSLAPSGRVVWHDWLLGPGGAPRYPLMWSADGTISFLIDAAAFAAALAAAGLELTRLQPIVARTRAWLAAPLPLLDKAIDRLAAATDDHVTRRRAGLHDLRRELTNALANVEEERLIPFLGEARPSADHRAAGRAPQSS